MICPLNIYPNGQFSAYMSKEPGDKRPTVCWNTWGDRRGENAEALRAKRQTATRQVHLHRLRVGTGSSRNTRLAWRAGQVGPSIPAWACQASSERQKTATRSCRSGAKRRKVEKVAKIKETRRHCRKLCKKRERNSSLHRIFFIPTDFCLNTWSS